MNSVMSWDTAQWAAAAKWWISTTKTPLPPALMDGARALQTSWMDAHKEPMEEATYTPEQWAAEMMLNAGIGSSLQQVQQMLQQAQQPRGGVSRGKVTSEDDPVATGTAPPPEQAMTPAAKKKPVRKPRG